jgi:enoyl-CoA hydratase/carnithine racemase
MKSDHILTKIEDKVLHIILNRPEKKNALTRAMYAELGSAIEQGEQEKNVRVILLYSKGDCFCAGNDIKDFQDLEWGSQPRTSGTLIEWLLKAKKPLIVAVHGYAIGVGATMLLHFDLIYAAKDAKFRFPFVNLGLVPEFGSSFNLPQIIGYQRAAELFLFGEFFTGEEAYKLGIVNKVFEEEELIEEVTKISGLLAEKPPMALCSTKALIKKHFLKNLNTLLPPEGQEFKKRQKSPEAQEAFAAFFERRKPDFSKLG